MHLWLNFLLEEYFLENPKLEDDTVNPIYVESKARKDMAAINCYVDRGATLKNFSCKKGTHQYANDSELSNSLKSILAGSIRCGDRLHAAGIIEDDKCTHPECGANVIPLCMFSQNVLGTKKGGTNANLTFKKLYYMHTSMLVNWRYQTWKKW